MVTAIVAPATSGPLDASSQADPSTTPSRTAADMPTSVDLDAQLDQLAIGTVESTSRQYRNRISLFASWCAARGLCAVPADPEVLSRYFGWLGEKGDSWTTIRGSHAAIVAAHRALGYEAPNSERVRAALREARRAASVVGRSGAIDLPMLRNIVATCGPDIAALRDRALLLVTYFARLLPREAAALHRDDAQRTSGGYLLKPPSRRKVDAVQVELGFKEDLELCPVRALDRWLEAYARATGAPGPCAPLFVALRGGRGYPLVADERISRRVVERVLRRRAAAAGLDASTVSVHGLRAGTPTQNSSAR